MPLYFKFASEKKKKFYVRFVTFENLPLQAHAYRVIRHWSLIMCLELITRDQNVYVVGKIVTDLPKPKEQNFGSFGIAMHCDHQKT